MWTQFDREANFISLFFFSLSWRLECAYSSLKKVPIQGKFEKFNEMEWSRWSGMVVGARAL